MVLIPVDDATTTSLRVLDTYPAAVSAELVRAAVSFLRKGSSRRVVEKAATKLRVPPESLSATLSAAARWLQLCARLDASPRDAQDSAAQLGLSQDSQDALCAAYESSAAELRALLVRADVGLPEYGGLRWRLDAAVGSRTLRNGAKPVYVLDFGVQGQHSVLESDPETLRYITARLEEALAESKTAASRRVMRNIK